MFVLVVGHADELIDDNEEICHYSARQVKRFRCPPDFDRDWPVLLIDRSYGLGVSFPGG